jgi:YD repeat-containing protein
MRSYRYDEAGRVLERGEICSELVSVNYSYEQHDTYTYDANGRVKERTTVNNFPASEENNYTGRWEYTYDDKGNVIRLHYFVTQTEENGGDWEQISIYEYDAEGRNIYHRQSAIYPHEPMRDSEVTYTARYNADGNLEFEQWSYVYPGDPVRDSTDTTVLQYRADGKLLRSQRTLAYVDAERQQHSGGSQTTEYTYDLLGRCILQVHTNAYERDFSNTQEKIEYTYRMDGTLKSAQIVYTDADSQTHSQNTYDENGLPILIRTQDQDEIHITEQTFQWFYIPSGEFPEDGIIQ